MSNLLKRTIVAFLLGPLVLLSIYFGEMFLLAITLIISGFAIAEALLMMKTKDIHPQLITGLIFGLLLPISFAYQNLSTYSLIFFFLFFIPLIELFRNIPNATANIASTFFLPAYIGVGVGSLIGIRNLFSSITMYNDALAFLTLSVIVSIWLCDSFAYFGGRLMGKTKLFPRVSPNKTWEGAIWGFIAAILTTLAFYYFTPMGKIRLTLQELILLGAIPGIFGQLGDLLESLIKRDTGVKDSSDLIPGHGGMFDRFDSLILVAPIAYFYLRFIIFPES